MREKIAIIGLGYVGLPLAIEFSKKYNVVGYDIDHKRIDSLNQYLDKTNQVNYQDLKNALQDNLVVSSKEDLLSRCNIYISTVPTPVKEDKEPDL